MTVTNGPVTARPSLVDASSGLVPQEDAVFDSWWFGTRLVDDRSRILWINAHLVRAGDAVVSTFALVRAIDGFAAEEHHVGGPSVPTTVTGAGLAGATPIVTLEGSADEIRLEGAATGVEVDLALHIEGHPLLNGGSGSFPWFNGVTSQFSFPSLPTSGTLKTAGEEFAVEGESWFDRQWAHGPVRRPTPFTWIGINLATGHSLSIWETSGDGNGWATLTSRDGTHIITDARLAPVDNGWSLHIDAVDATLAISRTKLASAPSFYTGVCEVTGSFEGQSTKGFGYTDINS